MIKLDDDLLKELGLAGLPPEDKKKLLAHIYETLEMRVGMKLAEQMTDAQLIEFEQFIDRNDEAGALKWLETHFPNYKDVVAAEFENLKAEISQVAPQILSASVQPSMPPQAPQIPMPPQPGQYAPGQPQQPMQQPIWNGDQPRTQTYQDPWAQQAPPQAPPQGPPGGYNPQWEQQNNGQQQQQPPMGPAPQGPPQQY